MRALILFSVNSFWEPNNGLGVHLQAHTVTSTMIIVTVLEAFCVAALVFDLYLQLTFTGISNWFLAPRHDKKHACLAVFIILSVLDFGISLTPGETSAINMCIVLVYCYILWYLLHFQVVSSVSVGHSGCHFSCSTQGQYSTCSTPSSAHCPC